MDNPFLPALICFGPFFAILLFHVLTPGAALGRTLSPEDLRNKRGVTPPPGDRLKARRSD